MATKRNYGVVPFKSPRNSGETRVYIAGDSMGDGLQSKLLPILNGLGYVTLKRTVAGQGLLDDPPHAVSNLVAGDITSFDPDVILFYWRGNYQSFGNAGTPGITVDTPEFYAAWTEEMRTVTTQAISRNAQVFWLIGPAMRTLDPNNPPDFIAAYNGNDIVTRTIAANTRTLIRTSFAKCGVISTYPYVADPWAEKNCAGVTLRTWDGLHFSDPDGQNLLANRVLAQIVPVLDV